MTNEERDLITKFVARVGGQAQSGGFMGGSVPASQPQLPPIDRDADSFIAQQFQTHPEARYRITQTAIVQEAALAEASNRIQRLQWELDQAKQAIQQAPNSQQSKGFFSSLFGGGAPAPQARPGGAWNQGAAPGGGYQPSSPPPPPQYPPSYQPGMFQRGGSGFLGSALTTAAGVAGGMVVGNALMDAFSGSHGSASTSPWGSNTSDTSGGMFDGSGVVPTDPTGGGLATGAGYNDPFSGGGGGMDQQTSWDGGGGTGGDFGGGGFDSGGGGFDSGGGGGGFDDNT